jgi:hypothetical protein
MADIRAMYCDRARLLAWVASAQNVAVVAAVALVLVAFAAAEVMKAQDLHFAEAGAFADPSGLSLVGVPTGGTQHVVLLPGLASGTIDPRRGG